MATQCEMIVGFLVPHRCDNRAVTQCAKCGRRFCDEHLEITPGGLICAACQQGLQEPMAIPQTARSFDEADIMVFAAASDFSDDDDDMFSDLS